MDVVTYHKMMEGISVTEQQVAKAYITNYDTLKNSKKKRAFRQHNRLKEGKLHFLMKKSYISDNIKKAIILLISISNEDALIKETKKKSKTGETVLNTKPSKDLKKFFKKTYNIVCGKKRVDGFY